MEEKELCYVGEPKALIALCDNYFEDKNDSLLLRYVFKNVDEENVVFIDSGWVNSVFKDKNTFKKVLNKAIKNKILFKTDSNFTYTLNVCLFTRMNIEKKLKLYENQLGKDSNTNLDLSTIKQIFTKLDNEDKKDFLQILNSMI